MNLKRILVILIVIVIVVIAIFAFYKNKNIEREDVKVPVLLYHNFVNTVPDNDPDNFNYINTPESFEENIKVLLENGYTIMSMQELNDAYNLKIKLPSKHILINFDDGYYSNYEYIYPILKKYNVKVAIFVVTDKVGKEIDEIKYLGWNECLEMQNSDLVEIFSHSKRHLFYDKFSTRVIHDDVIESYKVIEKNLGEKKLKVFAYPYGAYTKETVWTIKFSGIDMQVYDLGINNFKNFNKDYIKRINVPCEMAGKEIIDEIEQNN